MKGRYKTITVICQDLNDFKRWKNLFIELAGKDITSLLGNSIRKFQVKKKFYIGIYKPTHLCSVTIDKILYTSNAHLNPEYKQIMDIARVNLKTQEDPSRMKKYKDYYVTKKNKRAKKNDALTPEEIGGVRWTRFTIVVPTADDKTELRKAFRHFHNSNINTDNIVVNQLSHEYLEGPDIVVNKKLYNSIKKAEPTDEV